MSELTQLPKLVQEKNVKGFIAVYMQCIQSGFRLKVPRKKDIDELEDEWASILQKVVTRYDESFLVQLSALWLRILKNYQGQINDAAITAIIKKFDQYTKNSKESTPKRPPQIKASPSVRPPDENKASISQDYQILDVAMKSMVKDNQKRLSKAMSSLQEKSPIPFLIIYLSDAYFGSIPTVPRRTVMQVVRDEWESILLDRFNKVPNDSFMKQLVIEWTALLNLNGIPSDMESYQKLLFEN